jgi:ribosomal protein S18 acetylase RimI-like enzyme
MALSLRQAVSADAATIVELNVRLAEESEGKQLDRATLSAGVAAGLADPAKARYFVAEEDNVIVGQVMLTWEWSDWRNGWLWWIQSVYVIASARRRGVFRALYRHVRDLAVADPLVKGLRLYVERHNEAALATYLQLGMTDAGYQVLEEIFPGETNTSLQQASPLRPV